MKTTGIVMALLVGTALGAETLPAQSMAMDAGGPSVGGAPPAYNASAVRARMSAAHALAERGRFVEARKEYRRIADMQKQAGILPEEALWAVADRYNGAGDRLRAARTLDELAALAEAHGHPSLQARALAESSILHYGRGDALAVRTRVNRLKPLLDSPHLEASVRESIVQRTGVGREDA